MNRIGSLSDPASARLTHVVDGAAFAHKRQLIVPEDGRRDAPNAFLIEQQPGKVLAVHFHGAAQFQVVVRGQGTLGPHALGPVTVHYAGQRTPYGPITTVGDAALWYLTLRPQMESGLYWMPEARALRDPAIARREVFGQSAVVPDGGAVDVTRVELETVIAPQADGLAAWMLRLPAGSVATAPSALPCCGRYHVVIGGSVRLDGRELDWLSVVWSDAGDAPLEVLAGAAGAALLVLQFPEGATAHAAPAVSATALLKT